jgi:hypothetical protein
MGRYFGITNVTQNQRVSEGRQCWKNYPFCSCHAVMHRYHWHSTDKIVSGAYDGGYRFVYDPVTNRMRCNDDDHEEEPEPEHPLDYIDADDPPTVAMTVTEILESAKREAETREEENGRLRRRGRLRRKRVYPKQSSDLGFERVR